MPIYAYRCDSCGFEKDHLQKLNDPVLTSCPECHQDSYQKLVTAAGFQLKGNGWYATDFKGNSTASAKQEPPPRMPELPWSKRVRGQLIKRYFITGLLIWVPLGITAWVVSLIAGAADQSLRLLPAAIHPHNLIGFDIPGAGIVVTLVIIFITGLLAANFIGQRLVNWWERLLARIPVVNSIYNGVKQVSDTLFSSSGMAFRQPLLVQYPHQGAWTIAFLTGEPGGDVVNHLKEEHVSVYVPTTPNPTSGFFLMFPKSQVIELDMDVDQALKYIISMGVVAPPTQPKRST